MKLVLPSKEYAVSFASALAEMREDGHTVFWDEVGRPGNVDEYIRIRSDHAKGLSLPQGWIPATTYWLVDRGQVIGEVNIRHELTEFLRNIGGHIGYWIRPSKRQQGYGREILRLALEKARELGLDRVLITCDETNEGSRKIIEANGGVFERTQEMGEGEARKLLYWIVND